MRLLVSLLLLTACASESRKEPPPANNVFTCSGNDPACAAMAGVMLIITTAGTPFSAAERRVRARQISGTCEVLLPNVGGTDPCGTVLLTITDAAGRVRNAWVQDREFEIGNLREGPFTVLAESETWGVSATVENVRLGQRVAIQLKAKPRPQK